MDRRLARLIALAESCIGFALSQRAPAPVLKGLLPAYARLQRLAGS
jgi:hypothetical protein